MPKNDIKEFIDFFHDASLKIRRQKPVFIRGKDGNLVKLALKVFSREQLEALALWFLHKKRKMSPTIGAMLSNAVLEELKDTLKKPNFWKELDDIHERYFTESGGSIKKMKHFAEVNISKFYEKNNFSRK